MYQKCRPNFKQRPDLTSNPCITRMPPRQVFVGSFRGKGFGPGGAGAPRYAPAAGAAPAAAAPSPSTDTTPVEASKPAAGRARRRAPARAAATKPAPKQAALEADEDGMGKGSKDVGGEDWLNEEADPVADVSGDDDDGGAGAMTSIPADVECTVSRCTCYKIVLEDTLQVALLTA